MAATQTRHVVPVASRADISAGYIGLAASLLVPAPIRVDRSAYASQLGGALVTVLASASRDYPEPPADPALDTVCEGCE